MENAARRTGCRRVAVTSAFLAAVVLCLALAGAANAYVYWANDGSTDTTLGRANLDGSGAMSSFIGGGNVPCFVAVDANHIYWGNDFGNTIGRANLDGTGVNQNFITGANGPCGVAVDGTYIYWTNATNGTIGRAPLSDPSAAVQNFVTGATGPCGLATDGTYLYWGNNGTGGTTIGRAPLSNPSSANENFITGASQPCGVALDATYIYWGNFGNFNGTTIGRAPLSNPSAAVQSFVTGANEPCGIAVDANYIYWGNFGGTTIGRAPLSNPSAANESFITGASEPCGVALDSLPVSPTLTVSAPSTGTVGRTLGSSTVGAVLSGGASPVGTITFRVFGPQTTAPNSCASGGTTIGSATVSGNGTYHPSAGFTPTSAGNYWSYASYGGDNGDKPASSACSPSTAETVVTPPVATLTVGRAKVSGLRAKVPLGCGGDPGAECKVAAKLIAIETLKGGKVIAVDAAKHKRVTLASAATTLTGGQSNTIVLTLKATGRRLLAQFNRLKAKLTVSVSGKVVATRTVTFQEPKLSVTRDLRAMLDCVTALAAELV